MASKDLIGEHSPRMVGVGQRAKRTRMTEAHQAEGCLPSDPSAGIAEGLFEKRHIARIAHVGESAERADADDLVVSRTQRLEQRHMTAAAHSLEKAQRSRLQWQRMVAPQDANSGLSSLRVAHLLECRCGQCAYPRGCAAIGEELPQGRCNGTHLSQ